ncbi:RHS repeat protein, partial [Cronobacter malonaticus]
MFYCYRRAYDSAWRQLTQTVRFNRVTQLNGIQWRYGIHGRTVEKDNGQTRWRYRYDPLGRRISKT